MPKKRYNADEIIHKPRGADGASRRRPRRRTSAYCRSRPQSSRWCRVWHCSAGCTGGADDLERVRDPQDLAAELREPATSG